MRLPTTNSAAVNSEMNPMASRSMGRKSGLSVREAYLNEINNHHQNHEGIYNNNNRHLNILGLNGNDMGIISNGDLYENFNPGPSTHVVSSLSPVKSKEGTSGGGGCGRRVKMKRSKTMDQISLPNKKETSKKASINAQESAYVQQMMSVNERGIDVTHAQNHQIHSTKVDNPKNSYLNQMSIMASSDDRIYSSRNNMISDTNGRPSTSNSTSAARVTMQGWLYKQGSEGLMLWKKRWFVLSEFCLFYYKGPDESQICGSILLPSYKVSPVVRKDISGHGRRFSFKAEHQNMRTYFFAAESRESMARWLKALSLASMLQTEQQLTMSRQTVTAPSPPQVIHPKPSVNLPTASKTSPTVLQFDNRQSERRERLQTRGKVSHAPPPVPSHHYHPTAVHQMHSASGNAYQYSPRREQIKRRQSNANFAPQNAASNRGFVAHPPSCSSNVANVIQTERFVAESNGGMQSNGTHTTRRQHDVGIQNGGSYVTNRNVYPTEIPESNHLSTNNDLEVERMFKHGLIVADEEEPHTDWNAHHGKRRVNNRTAMRSKSTMDSPYRHHRQNNSNLDEFVMIRDSQGDNPSRHPTPSPRKLRSKQTPGGDGSDSQYIHGTCYQNVPENNGVRLASREQQRQQRGVEARDAIECHRLPGYNQPPMPPHSTGERNVSGETNKTRMNRTVDTRATSPHATDNSTFHRTSSLRSSSRSTGSQMQSSKSKEQQHEESMKRLLEWKQRMLQSPLTRRSAISDVKKHEIRQRMCQTPMDRTSYSSPRRSHKEVNMTVPTNHSEAVHVKKSGELARRKNQQSYGHNRGCRSQSTPRFASTSTSSNHYLCNTSSSSDDSSTNNHALLLYTTKDELITNATQSADAHTHNSTSDSSGSSQIHQSSYQGIDPDTGFPKNLSQTNTSSESSGTTRVSSVKSSVVIAPDEKYHDVSREQTVIGQQPVYDNLSFNGGWVVQPRHQVAEGCQDKLNNEELEGTDATSDNKLNMSPNNFETSSLQSYINVTENRTPPVQQDSQVTINPETSDSGQINKQAVPTPPRFPMSRYPEQCHLPHYDMLFNNPPPRQRKDASFNAEIYYHEINDSTFNEGSFSSNNSSNNTGRVASLPDVIKQMTHAASAKQKYMESSKVGEKAASSASTNCSSPSSSKSGRESASVVIKANDNFKPASYFPDNRFATFEECKEYYSAKKIEAEGGSYNRDQPLGPPQGNSISSGSTRSSLSLTTTTNGTTAPASNSNQDSYDSDARPKVVRAMSCVPVSTFAEQFTVEEGQERIQSDEIDDLSWKTSLRRASLRHHERQARRQRNVQTTTSPLLGNETTHIQQRVGSPSQSFLSTPRHRRRLEPPESKLSSAINVTETVRELEEYENLATTDNTSDQSSIISDVVALDNRLNGPKRDDSCGEAEAMIRVESGDNNKKQVELISAEGCIEAASSSHLQKPSSNRVVPDPSEISKMVTSFNDCVNAKNVQVMSDVRRSPGDDSTLKNDILQPPAASHDLTIEQPVITVQELLNKSHDELLVLLIFLRRQSALLAEEICNVQAQFDDMTNRRKKLQNTQNALQNTNGNDNRQWCELRFTLQDLLNRRDRTHPILSLVENMVKLGALYRGSNEAPLQSRLRGLEVGGGVPSLTATQHLPASAPSNGTDVDAFMKSDIRERKAAVQDNQSEQRSTKSMDSSCELVRRLDVIQQRIDDNSLEHSRWEHDLLFLRQQLQSAASADMVYYGLNTSAQTLAIESELSRVQQRAQGIHMERSVALESVKDGIRQLKRFIGASVVMTAGGGCAKSTNNGGQFDRESSFSKTLSTAKTVDRKDSRIESNNELESSEYINVDSSDKIDDASSVRNIKVVNCDKGQDQSIKRNTEEITTSRDKDSKIYENVERSSNQEIQQPPLTPTFSAYERLFNNNVISSASGHQQNSLLSSIETSLSNGSLTSSNATEVISAPVFKSDAAKAIVEEIGSTTGCASNGPLTCRMRSRMRRSGGGAAQRSMTISNPSEVADALNEHKRKQQLLSAQKDDQENVVQDLPPKSCGAAKLRPRSKDDSEIMRMYSTSSSPSNLPNSVKSRSHVKQQPISTSPTSVSSGEDSSNYSSSSSTSSSSRGLVSKNAPDVIRSAVMMKKGMCSSEGSGNGYSSYSSKKKISLGSSKSKGVGSKKQGPQSMIDEVLDKPEKIAIPERYIPDENDSALEGITTEERQIRLKKADSIRRMLMATSSPSTTTPSLNVPLKEVRKSPDINNNSNGTFDSGECNSSLLTRDQEERGHLLAMNQVIAQQVMEKSRQRLASTTSACEAVMQNNSRLNPF